MKRKDKKVDKVKKVDYNNKETLLIYVDVGKTIKDTKISKIYGEGAIPLIKILALEKKLKKNTIIKVEDFYKNTLREGKKEIRKKNHLEWVNTHLRKLLGGKILLSPLEEKEGIIEKVKVIK